MRWGWHRWVMHMLAGSGLVLTVACGGGADAPPPSPPSPPPPPPQAPAFTAQPVALAVIDGSPATLTVTVSGAAPLTYQWQKNAVAIAGATAASYTTPPLGLADSGAAYRVAVSGPGGSVTSDAATVTVNARPPVIDVQPQAAAAVAGGTATFEVQVSGSQPLAFQWYRGGLAVSGATSRTLTVGALAYGDDASTYTVEVSNVAGMVTSVRAALGVAAAEAAQVLTACREITTPGHYRLQANVGSPATNQPCIRIHDTHDVLLDCSGFKITHAAPFGPALALQNVQRFSIRNCHLQVGQVDVQNSADGSLARNTITTPVEWTAMRFSVLNLFDSRRVTVDDNTIETGTVQFLYGDGNTVSRNRISAPPGTNSVGGTVVSVFGRHMRILANTLNGRWNGVRPWQADGGDDGVVLQDETNAVVEDNTINDFFDCGIEFAGTITASWVRRNRVTNTGVCGIGAWYWSSVAGTTFAQNTVARSPTIFLFTRTYGLRAAGFDDLHRMPADTAVLFENNVFDGNVLLDPLLPPFQVATYIPLTSQLNFSGYLSALPGERAPTPSEFRLLNNLFRNNDFSHVVGWPDFGPPPFPPGMVIDGGGNKCMQPVGPFPLKCN